MTARVPGAAGSDDGGFAMVLVVGFTAVVMGLVGAHGHRHPVAPLLDRPRPLRDSLSVAEAGVDATLATINTAYSTGSTYVTTGPCALTAPASFATRRRSGPGPATRSPPCPPPA